MASRLTALIAVAFAFTGLAGLAADEAKKGQCVQNAFATKLGFTPEQKEQVAKICDESEQKFAPVCEKLWTLHCQHGQAVLQILTEEQRGKLPEVMKGERKKMLDQFATKLEFNDAQKKEAERICNDYAPKYQQLADQNDSKKGEKFQELKFAQLEEFCKILTDDQRVKLPMLIREEMQDGRTPSAKSEYRNNIAEQLGLNDDQKTRLDKVCDEFAPKIDEQKTQIRQLFKDKHAAISKILTEQQRTKFEEFVKADQEK